MTDSKREQINKLTQELGYLFYLNPMPREGLNSSGEFVTYDKYMIIYKLNFNGVKGESKVLFDTLDQVIDYLKKKKNGRVKRKHK